MITAIVPIKKDSQRVESKNFTKINSKPLFYWILNSLQNSKYISEIIVNHDDEFTEIKYLYAFKIRLDKTFLVAPSISSKSKNCRNSTNIKL